ncbi:MAG: hypothetical protein M3Y27_11900, partial [Acidobacteriota bacterium]|nr:hypothetical protein [Acidobacteriota bacterium]
VVETGEDPDADRGMERLTAILRELPGGGLPDVMETMLAAATINGVQHDDATVLLMRCCENGIGSAPVSVVDPARTREATWLKLLDELAEELSGE